jgi:hypothetical protein
MGKLKIPCFSPSPFPDAVSGLDADSTCRQKCCVHKSGSFKRLCMLMNVILPELQYGTGREQSKDYFFHSQSDQSASTFNWFSNKKRNLPWYAVISWKRITVIFPRWLNRVIGKGCFVHRIPCSLATKRESKYFLVVHIVVSIQYM